jgi:hypothetical protein
MFTKIKLKGIAMTTSFEEELDGLIQEHRTALSQSRHEDASDTISEGRVFQLQTRCLAAIERAAGRNSIYFEQAKSLLSTKNHAWGHLLGQIGVVESLLHNMRSGYLKTLEELVHGEIFGDFLEMSKHLLDSGYKDAAAVVCGSTLEAHLKQLCKKANIPTDQRGKPKKADTINAELAAIGIYSKLDLKNVTAWLGIRNSAAHGNYGDYDKNQVYLVISSVRDFITRVPA